MSISQHSEQLLLSEIQVLLAEKRTYYSLLRTGLGIGSIPFTVIIFLVATSQYHGIFNYAWLAGIILFALLIISIEGIKITYDSRKKISRLDKMIKTIKK